MQYTDFKVSAKPGITLMSAPDSIPVCMYLHQIRSFDLRGSIGSLSLVGSFSPNAVYISCVPEALAY